MPKRHKIWTDLQRCGPNFALTLSYVINYKAITFLLAVIAFRFKLHEESEHHDLGHRSGFNTTHTCFVQYFRTKKTPPVVLEKNNGKGVKIGLISDSLKSSAGDKAIFWPPLVFSFLCLVLSFITVQPALKGKENMWPGLTDCSTVCWVTMLSFITALPLRHSFFHLLQFSWINYFKKKKVNLWKGLFVPCNYLIEFNLGRYWLKCLMQWSRKCLTYAHF